MKLQILAAALLLSILCPKESSALPGLGASGSVSGRVPGVNARFGRSVSADLTNEGDLSADLSHEGDLSADLSHEGDLSATEDLARRIFEISRRLRASISQVSKGLPVIVCQDVGDIVKDAPGVSQGLPAIICSAVGNVPARVPGADGSLEGDVSATEDLARRIFEISRRLRASISQASKGLPVIVCKDVGDKVKGAPGVSQGRPAIICRAVGNIPDRVPGVAVDRAESAVDASEGVVGSGPGAVVDTAQGAVDTLG